MRSSIVNPVSGEKMFLLWDSVHNFKNVYNNWVNKGTFEYPAFDEDSYVPLVADFNDIRALHDREKHLPVKTAHELKTMSMRPSNIDRLSVQHAVSVFDDSTLSALKFL